MPRTKRASTTTPYVRPEPTAAERATAETWRSIPDAAEAWHAFYAFAARERWQHEVDLPPSWAADALERIELTSGAQDRVLVVCHKLSTKHLIERVSSSTSLAFESKAAVAFHEASVTRWTTRSLEKSVNAFDLQLAFLGDVDPEAIFHFAALRAGGQKALLAERRSRHAIAWVLNDRVIGAIAKQASLDTLIGARTIPMGWLAREYWEIVKRLVPDAKRVIGPHAFQMLEDGHKLEVDALQHEDEFGFRDPVRKALLRLAR